MDRSNTAPSGMFDFFLRQVNAMNLIRRYLLLNALVGLGAIAGCKGPSTEDPPFPDATDLPREDAVRLLGEPTSVLELPFPEKFKSACTNFATSALVYKPSKEQTVILCLDESGRVLRQVDYLTFIER